MKRLFIYLFILICLLPCLGGCSSSQSFIVRYDIEGPVENLDPQFATDSTARMIISNIYEGLVVYEPGVGIVPGAASSYEVSSDGLTYTFTLRDGAAWSDGTPLTSSDFLYAFQRLFSQNSPHAADYTFIQNSNEVLSGTMDSTLLGITTPDEKTIIFTLASPSPFFLESLAATPASPCNRDAFLESRGRYGLEPGFVFSNGPFKLDRWNNESAIQLRKNEYYVSDSPVLAGGVTLYIGRSNPTQQFLNGKSDLIAVPYEQATSLEGKASTFASFDETTWCIVFNQSDPALGNPLLRQSLIHVLDSKTLNEILAPSFSTTRDLVPPAVMLGEQSYRELAGSTNPIHYDLQRSEYLYQLALSALELERLPSITLIVPETSSHYQYTGDLQQEWQKHLGAYIHLETATTTDIANRFRTGRYQMLLMPFSPDAGTIDSLLDDFTSNSSKNYMGYQNARYDTLLANAAGSSSLNEAAAQYAMAETLLLSDAVVMPLYVETTTYAMAEKVNGIQIAPFANNIYFKYAQKQ